MDRRDFVITSASLAGTTSLATGSTDAPAAIPVPGSGGGLDPLQLKKRLNGDADFLLRARYWDCRIRLEIGTQRLDLVMKRGGVDSIAAVMDPGAHRDLRLAGPVDAWTHGNVMEGITVEGEGLGQYWPYQWAIQRLVQIVREHNGAEPQVISSKRITRKFDVTVGRYVYIDVHGVQYRVYFEEAGKGIPVLLQHTAGSDGRQWRHLLEDTELQHQFRFIAYDLPFHGKSLPPTTSPWWEKEYRLTQDLAMDTIIAISGALDLHRPVFMGCSVGGFLAPDLVLYHPEKFRACIGINSAIRGERAPSTGSNDKADHEKPISERAAIDDEYHPRINNESIGASMYGGSSPKATEEFRREIAWCYDQGAPGVFAGDLYYYYFEHDLVGKTDQIDTTKCPLYLLSGEYDGTSGLHDRRPGGLPPSVTAQANLARPPVPDGGKPGIGAGPTLAAQIKGAKYRVIEGAAHFAMSEAYPEFRRYLEPILSEIASRNI